MSHQKSSTISLVRSAPKLLALAAIVTVHGFAQNVPTLQKLAVKAVDPILGFESAKAWVVKSSTPLTTVSTTTNRTQGALSLMLGNPSSNFSMTSLAVASTSPALADLDNVGSVFQLDIMPSAKADGTLQLLVSSPSRGLRSAVAGETDLKGLRPGIFNTVSFPVTEAIRKALGAAVYTDLSFELAMKQTSASLTAATGTSFLFDNLRVSSVSLLTLQPGAANPVNYGGVVNLSATGSVPVKQSFEIGSVQVPETFAWYREQPPVLR